MSVQEVVEWLFNVTENPPWPRVPANGPVLTVSSASVQATMVGLTGVVIVDRADVVVELAGEAVGGAGEAEPDAVLVEEVGTEVLDVMAGDAPA